MIPGKGSTNLGKRARRAVATATVFTFLCQNFAWAVCADGSTFPAGGFVAGQPPVIVWSPGLGGEGSVFIPDISVFEHNDPSQPVTGGGHNWVYGGPCKAIDVGPAGGTPTAWTISSDCVLLPPLQSAALPGQAITPTCTPALLSQAGAPNPANTRLNQLGCAISHGVATTPQTAITFMFVASGGLFVAQLVNLAPTIGGDAGKIVVSIDSYSDIPAGQKFTNGAVSPDGMFAAATSLRRLQAVSACLNPLGDPGDPSLPIDPNFAIPPASQVKCMVVGGNGLQVDLTTVFGPDNQPYFGGQRTVNTFNADPGGSSATAWPQCTFNGFVFSNPPPTTLMDKLKAVFNAHSPNHCGNAVPNVGFSASPVIQPGSLISHGSYMYSGGSAQPVVQFKVTVDPATGLSQYAHRTYVSGGTAFNTGLGAADDLKSFMDFTDPSGLGLAGQQVILKMPLCEDM